MSEDELAIHQLNNLGYTGSLKQMVVEFQVDNDLPTADWFDQATADALKRIHDGGVEAEVEEETEAAADSAGDFEARTDPWDDDTDTG